MVSACLRPQCKAKVLGVQNKLLPTWREVKGVGGGKKTCSFDQQESFIVH